MQRTLSLNEIVQLTDAGWPLADVRSPSEYARGHVPGALSLPLFDDAERAEVGTAYKQLGRTPAVMLGLSRAGPRLAQLAEQGQALAHDKRLALMCWRGGMRSGAVAWLLEQVGLEVVTLRGGYKTWRQLVLHTFTQRQDVRVVGGLTGAGKTLALHALARRCEQVVDLEALAAHRGSSFGAIGQPEAPTQEHFENRLADAWRRLDPTRPVWLEDESRHLGRLHIPAPIWAQLVAAPVYVLEVPQPLRLQALVADYGALPAEQLIAATERLTKRLGGLVAQQAVGAIAEGDLDRACGLLLDYYDRTYRHGLSQRPAERVQVLPLNTADPEAAAEALLRAAREPHPLSTNPI